VYEGEQEGPAKVAQHLLSQALRNVFAELFPDTAKARKRSAATGDPYGAIVAHVEERPVELPYLADGAAYRKALRSVPGLLELVKERHAYLDEEESFLWAEFVLHGLAEHSRIARSTKAGGTRFSDLFNSMLSADMGEEDDDTGRPDQGN
jgi:magnesium chelatase subunit I